MPPIAPPQSRQPNGASLEINSPSDFALATLSRLGIEPTADNLRAMVAWVKQEGGHWHNSAKYNPLNTTHNLPGSGDTGVQGNISVYQNWGQGVDATVATLRNGKYDEILAKLKNGTWEEIVDAISASPWNPAEDRSQLRNVAKNVKPQEFLFSGKVPGLNPSWIDRVAGFATEGNDFGDAGFLNDIGDAVTSPFKLAKEIWERLSSGEFWLSVGKILMGLIAIVLGIRYFAKSYA